MKSEPTTAGRSLRTVSLAITLISIITFTTLVYSAYEDIGGILGLFGGQTTPNPPTLQTVVSGNTALIELNLSISNRGLYPVSLRISCAPPPGLPVSCQLAQATVGQGNTQGLHLIIMVSDIAGLKSIAAGGQGIHLNATATASLEPFASVSANFDLGSILAGAHL